MKIQLDIINNEILKKLMDFISDLPRGQVKIVNEAKDKAFYIPPVDDEEQKEIEKILKNPDCHKTAFSETIEI